MTARIEPTPEDLAIVAKNVRRMIRWDAEAKRARPNAHHAVSDVLARRAAFVGALRRMTADYVEFRPTSPPIGARMAMLMAKDADYTTWEKAELQRAIEMGIIK